MLLGRFGRLGEKKGPGKKRQAARTFVIPIPADRAFFCFVLFWFGLVLVNPVQVWADTQLTFGSECSLRKNIPPTQFGQCLPEKLWLSNYSSCMREEGRTQQGPLTTLGLASWSQPGPPWARPRAAPYARACTHTPARTLRPSDTGDPARGFFPFNLA